MPPHMGMRRRMLEKVKCLNELEYLNSNIEGTRILNETEY
jgi:hypothetical protein